jgi:thiamine kinase-like enzyme
MITLIDFEYGGWNPIQFDLANYLNELELDNAHPKGTGIKYYPENAATDAERQSLLS